MASNQTQNFQLPQWEANDPILRADFNAAMATLDTALKNLTPVVGTYTGDGKYTEEGGQDITLGFRPRFVIITAGWTGTEATSFYLCGENSVSPVICMTDTGFRVLRVHSTTISYVGLNRSGVAYDYIAFR